MNKTRLCANLCLVAAYACFAGATLGCGAPDGEPALPTPAPPPDGSDGPDAPVPTPRVRFIAVGDTGKGNAGQYQVAEGIRQVCAAQGCDFVILLGDNIYDRGVTSTSDPKWEEAFEAPYAAIDLPFYAILGNHDYGGKLALFPIAGLGNEFDRGAHEVAYSDVSSKWRMPYNYYAFRQAHVGFIALDTNAILWDDTTYGDQAAWLASMPSEVAEAPWKIILGHHPYRSNGSHGNAGQYEAQELLGLEIPNPLPIQNGTAMKTFFETQVCGLGDLYLSGHDHSRQWLQSANPLCGMDLVVSGAGAEVTSLADKGNTPLFEDASELGFLYVDIEGDTLTGRFYNADGAVSFERVITHP